MTKDMNSAQRLHAYLSLFGGARRERPEEGLLSVWDGVLDSRGNEELPALDVAKLVGLVIDVRETAQVFDQIGKDVPLRTVMENVEEWLKPMYFTGVNDLEHLDEEEDITVSAESLSALELLGEIFQETALGADELDKNKVENLVSQFEELTKNVREAIDLPEELRLRVLTALYAILQSLNDYRIGGARAVEVAVDGLTATLFRLGNQRETTWWKKAMVGALRAYAILGVAVTVHDGAQMVTDGAEAIRQITAS